MNSEHASNNMSDNPVNLFKLLDAVVLERESSDTFTVLTEPTEWFWELIPDAKVGHTCTAVNRSDYLDNFLFDAEEFWFSVKPGRVSSGPWTETDKRGTELSLEAEAFKLDGRLLVMVKRLGREHQERMAMLQTARESALTREQLEEEVRKRTAQIRHREQELVYRLMGAGAYRDEETGAHIRRIGLFSGKIAAGLGWKRRHVDELRLAGAMHDIGKIGIPDKILLKPGKHTAEETRMMQLHTVIGSNMLAGSEIPVIRMARDIAYHHHERWDGKGYPVGLEEEAIPESARIVSIVDVYDAMIEVRVYKPAIPEEEVLAYMKERSGTRFDPRIFDEFMHQLPELRTIRAMVDKDDPDLGMREALARL